MKLENISGKRVIVGMSGGVDSSVAALLLKEAGYHVEGLFMKNWEEDDTSSQCSAEQDVKDAENVCNILKIPLHTINFSKSYWENVFIDFLKEYQAGRTPNPDILCNREIKFKLFLNYAKSLGADYIATGHYANSVYHHQTGYELHRARDANKDQSYFLYTLTQDALAKSLFPLHNISKTEVRDLAQKAGFLNHQKKDSVGICFIGEKKFSPFLKQYLKPSPGNIENENGRILGQHQGLMFYTIGQRQGLQIGGQSNTDNAPWYVAAKDIERNVLVVVQGENHPLLFKSKLVAEEIHWINPNLPAANASASNETKVSNENKIKLFNEAQSFECTAKIRYRQVDQACIVRITSDNAVEVVFPQAQRAVTPGQSIVFYQGERCLGGGIIQ